MPGSTKRKRTASKPKGTAKRRKVANKVSRAKAAVGRAVVTDQYDKRVDYVHVKKRYNKNAVAFKKKVQAAIGTQYPRISKIYNVSSTNTTTTGTAQTYQIFHLKPWDGIVQTSGSTAISELAQNDLKDIATELQAVDLDPGAGVVGLSFNYWVNYAYMDVFVTNSTDATNMVLECYELDYVPRAGNPINQYGNLQAVIVAAQTSTTSLGTGYNMTQIGVSPFDIVELIRSFGVRVVKKMTVDLKAKDTFVYTMKDYRKHYVNGQSAFRDLSEKFCVQNMTKSVLIVGKPLTGTDAVSMRAKADKHYRIQPTNKSQEYTAGGSN